MRSKEISTKELQEILESSRDLTVKDHTPKSIPKRTSRLLIDKDEDIAPEVILKERIKTQIEGLELQDIKDHLKEKYGAIAEPQITNVKLLQASIGYHPDHDHQKMADYKVKLGWGYTPKAFGEECEDYKIGHIDITGEEQNHKVIDILTEDVGIKEVSDYCISDLVKKKPRRKRFHPRRLL